MCETRSRFLRIRKLRWRKLRFRRLSKGVRVRGQSHDMVQLLTPEGERVHNEGFEFTGSTEDLVGYLRTSTIGEGEHTLHIRALDTNGLWTMPAAARPFTVTQFLGKLGDLNDDDQVDLKDAILSLMVVNGQTPPTLRTDYVSSGVDVDNWQVGLPEAIYVLKKTAE